MVSTIHSTMLTNADLAPDATPITTGAAPVTADPDVRHYAITTGGTGGAETIDLPDGVANVGLLGQRMLLQITALTNPADSVLITVGGSSPSVSTAASGAFVLYNQTTSVKLTDTSQYISMVWVGTTWRIDLQNTVATTVYAPEDSDFEPLPKLTGNGVYARLRGGTANAVGGTGGPANVVGGYSYGGNGGPVNLIGGDADDTGNGGDVLIQGGTSGNGGTSGRVLYIVPTADPHHAGALWMNGATPTISAG